MKSIDLLVGRPSLNLQAADKLIAASRTILSQSEKSEPALTYGPDHGDDRIRRHIGAWLSQKYRPVSGNITQDRIIITNGASGALSGILQKFTDPLYTRRIFLVEPTYFLAAQTFLDAGFGRKMRGIPEDDEGIHLEYLRRQLEEDSMSDDSSDIDMSATKFASQGFRKLFKYVLYVVPTLSNPTGKTMSLQHRIALVELARRYDMLLIADDVYDFLAWPDDDDIPHEGLELPQRLVDIDRQMPGLNEWGNAVSNGSFSKLAAPGLRVGWCEAMPNFISGLSTVGATISGGCQAQYTSFLVDDMLVSGILEHHIQNTLIPIYRRRYKALVQAIKTYLYPLGIRISTGKPYEVFAIDGKGNRVPTILAGGFFLYIDFPSGDEFPSATEIIRIGREEYGLTIAPGEIFAVKGDPNGLERARSTFNLGTRLCWAWNEEEVLVEAMERFAKAIQQAKEPKV
ncbi:PLP-dependent transferase [Daldinia bambusicola]|nr:PLP-dependent transferase [Daldinia bambusicola]